MGLEIQGHERDPKNNSKKILESTPALTAGTILLAVVSVVAEMVPGLSLFSTLFASFAASGAVATVSKMFLNYVDQADKEPTIEDELGTLIKSIQPVDPTEPENYSRLALKACHQIYLSNYARLTKELSALRYRANINLLIGILCAGSGIGFLAWALINNGNLRTEPAQILNIFGLRLSVGVFLQVIAFFFLRLYRSSLIDLKYYQNELTNIQHKHQATIIACLGDDEGLVEKVVDSLNSTERNRILEKGQSSVGLENSASLLDNDFRLISDLMKAVADHHEKSEKKKGKE